MPEKHIDNIAAAASEINHKAYTVRQLSREIKELIEKIATEVEGLGREDVSEFVDAFRLDVGIISAASKRLVNSTGYGLIPYVRDIEKGKR